jgi:DNA-binding GntR family transcriptional regulator
LSTVDAKDPNLVASRVERALEELILNGEYGPGERIKENALAERLGVSRAPVREACRSLQRDGLLDIVPNQGAFVRVLTLAEIVNLFDVRACLGRLAGELAAAAMTRGAMQQLRDLTSAMDEASRSADASRYIDFNIAFHASLYAATGNARLATLDAQMGKELRIYRRHGLAFGGGLAVSNVEHRAILAAIEQGDRVTAGGELEKHIQNGRDRFIRAMSATGQLVLKDTAAGAPDRKKRSRTAS